MEPQDFVKAYESALSTQSWPEVAPLMHEDACVTFSTGSVHRGKKAVQEAFESNFAAIFCESYRITNLHWVTRTPTHAVCLFDFDWTGIIAGESAAGGGRGTCTLVHEAGQWKLLAEHLSPRA